MEALRLYSIHLISISSHPSLLPACSSRTDLIRISTAKSESVVAASMTSRGSLLMLSSCSLYQGWAVAHFSDDLYEASTCAVYRSWGSKC